MAQLLASVGLNVIVLNNINACDPENRPLMTSEYLQKAGALAGVFASYGLGTMLSPCFASPMYVGGKHSADPLDPAVVSWWKRKSAEAAVTIPGFTGYLIKADSESEQGPSVYNRSIPQAANMLARALEQHNAMCIWRSFKHPVCSTASI